MSKKSSTSMFALLTGIAAGAAAVFFSKKENREMAKEGLTKAEKKVKGVAEEVKKDPKKFAKKVQTQGTKLAKQVVEEVSKTTKSPAVKKTKTRAKKAAKKARKQV